MVFLIVNGIRCISTELTPESKRLVLIHISDYDASRVSVKILRRPHSISVLFFSLVALFNSLRADQGQFFHVHHWHQSRKQFASWLSIIWTRTSSSRCLYEAETWGKVERRSHASFNRGILPRLCQRCFAVVR